MNIKSTNIYAFRIFDLGQQIDLKLAKKTLEDKDISAFQVESMQIRSLLIVERPLIISLEPVEQSIAGISYTLHPTARLWSFGTLSIEFKIEYNRSHTLEDLNHIANFLENDDQFHKEAKGIATKLQTLIKPSIESPCLWSEYEDYLMFSIEEFTSPVDDLKKDLLDNSLAGLILAEKPMLFSNETLDSFKPLMFQYGKDDLVLIHWNGALIYDPEDSQHIRETIEFALCQLLELRYYDHLLENQLNTLYAKIEEKKSQIWSSPYHELSKQAALEYIDISEIVARVGNAFKITGDYYFATLFRAATKEFRINDWKSSVSHKLSNLAEVSKLFHGEINEKRNQILEITIVILIAIEVIPFLYKLI